MSKIPCGTDCYYCINNMTCLIHIYIIISLYLLLFLKRYPRSCYIYTLLHCLVHFTFSIIAHYCAYHVLFCSIYSLCIHHACTLMTLWHRQVTIMVSTIMSLVYLTTLSYFCYTPCGNTLFMDTYTLYCIYSALSIPCRHHYCICTTQ